MNGRIMGSKGLLSFLFTPLLRALFDVWGRKFFLLLSFVITCSPIPLMNINLPASVALLLLSQSSLNVSDVTDVHERSISYGLATAPMVREYSRVYRKEANKRTLRQRAILKSLPKTAAERKRAQRAREKAAKERGINQATTLQQPLADIMGTLDELCRICSDNLTGGQGVGIFSPECMENLVGEKITRYLYFSVSIKDNLPKKVCKMCLKKLDNIHLFAKMAAEMQEKFRMLLSQEAEQSLPKIKIRSLQELNGETIKEEPTQEEGVNGTEQTSNGNDGSEEGSEEEGEEAEDVEMAFDGAVEEIGDSSQDLRIDETSAISNRQQDVGEDHAEDEKPNPSLLHTLLLKGKERTSTDIDHDYLMPIKNEINIKDEPEDPEDEDIAEEIEEDRLNQIIKDELESDTDDDEGGGSDIEITEMEVKVDPMLYFSQNNDLENDSQDSQKQTGSKKKNESNSAGSSSSSLPNSHLVMTRTQQRSNPVIASLKLGKPYKCTVCPRSFITDIGLQNHLWSHLPKAKKTGGGAMVHKNVDMEDSQVYSSNGVLHTAMPSENPYLLKYACPICGKKISTKGNLKVHLETHRPKGKYGCDICGRVFKTAANLYRHKDYHGGVQFPCSVCGRVYPTNSTLRAHSITHSDLRPHKCPLCSKTFKRNQDLKFHINQHTGARPYQCPYCPKAFASSGNCFSHRKRMHPVEVERDKERAAEIMG